MHNGQDSVIFCFNDKSAQINIMEFNIETDFIQTIIKMFSCIFYLPKFPRGYQERYRSCKTVFHKKLVPRIKNYEKLFDEQCIFIISCDIFGNHLFFIMSFFYFWNYQFNFKCTEVLKLNFNLNLRNKIYKI